MKVKACDAICLFLLSCFLFTLGVATQEVVGFESRFYLFAEDMWRHGITVFPTTYQHPYPDYPVLPTLLIYVVSLFAGHLSKLTAVLPSAIASAGTVTVTYLIGARQSRLWGWYSAWFLLLTAAFVIEARTISLDQFVTLSTVLCFYFFVSNKSYVWIGIGLIFSFFCRGPLGIVIPTSVMCMVCLVDKEITRFFKIGLFSLFLLVISSVVLLGLAYHAGGENFMQEVIRMQVGSRLNDAHMPPFYYYFTDSLGAYAVTYPLSIMLFLCTFSQLVKKSKNNEMRLLRQCFAWVLVLLIGLSLAADKKIRYILPIAPALAIVCGYIFAGMNRNRCVAYLSQFVRVSLMILPGVVVIIAYLFLAKLNALGVNVVLVIALCVALQIMMWVCRFSVNSILIFAVLTFFVVNVLMIEKMNFMSNRTRDFVMHVEGYRASLKTPLIFFREDPDGLPIKYVVNTPVEINPLYLNDSKALAALPPHTLVIMRKGAITHLPKEIVREFREVMCGKIGHDFVEVWERE